MNLEVIQVGREQKRKELKKQHNNKSQNTKKYDTRGISRGIKCYPAGAIELGEGCQ